MEERSSEAAERAAAIAAAFAPYAPLFGRREARHRAEQYVRGVLLAANGRRNAENLAHAAGDATPRSLQRLLTASPWPVEPVIDALQRAVARHLGAPDGAFVASEIAFPKQGTKSVGVARQPSGRGGKVANCQIGLLLAYASSRGRALIDARLYLPRGWADDPARRRATGVPDTVAYAAKEDLIFAMLGAARTRGHLAGDWFASDEPAARVPAARDALDAAGRRYVLAVPPNAPIFAQPKGVTGPATSTPLAARPAQDLGAAVAARGWQEVPVPTGWGTGESRIARFAARCSTVATASPVAPAGWSSAATATAETRVTICRTPRSTRRLRSSAASVPCPPPSPPCFGRIVTTPGSASTRSAVGRAGTTTSPSP